MLNLMHFYEDAIPKDHHWQHGLFPLCWTGGQGTDPNEQNTQQSPANGLSFTPQPLQI